MQAQQVILRELLKRIMLRFINIMASSQDPIGLLYQHKFEHNRSLKALCIKLTMIGKI